MQEKEYIMFFFVCLLFIFARIEKSVPRDHGLASLGEVS